MLDKTDLKNRKSEISKCFQAMFYLYNEQCVHVFYESPEGKWIF